jgi:hypothetical protein
MPFASVARGDFRWTDGEDEVRWVKSSSFGRRAFCSQCGTPLQVQVAHQPETVDFPIVTLDDPDAIAPAFHIFWDSKVDWFDPADDLPRHGKFRPETRGLKSADPPDESSLTGGRRDR